MGSEAGREAAGSLSVGLWGGASNAHQAVEGAPAGPIGQEVGGLIWLVHS